MIHCIHSLNTTLFSSYKYTLHIERALPIGSTLPFLPPVIVLPHSLISAFMSCMILGIYMKYRNHKWEPQCLSETD